jgi:hypothetical protein
MARAKRKSSKTAAKKATRKPQKAAKRSKASKPKARAAKPQDAPGSVTKGFLNVYRPGGSYAAVVSGLSTLGIGRMHDRDSVLEAIRNAMGENWSSFAKKENRSEKTGKDAHGRAWQNCAVLARPQYAAKLRAAGYEVRFSGREKLCGLFKVGSE